MLIVCFFSFTLWIDWCLDFVNVRNDEELRLWWFNFSGAEFEVYTTAICYIGWCSCYDLPAFIIFRLLARLALPHNLGLLFRRKQATPGSYHLSLRISQGRSTLGASNHSLYLTKLTIDCSYPEGNFGKNQLLDGSISLSPLYPNLSIEWHVRIANEPQPEFLVSPYSYIVGAVGSWLKWTRWIAAPI